jgi:hypothetical protein
MCCTLSESRDPVIGHTSFLQIASPSGRLVYVSSFVTLARRWSSDLMILIVSTMFSS